MDIMTNPWVLALFALLGVPLVTSAVTGLVRQLADRAKIPPKVTVYVVSAALTLLIGWNAVPVEWTGDPVAFVAGWQLWLTTNAELARRLYEATWEKLYPPEE